MLFGLSFFAPTANGRSKKHMYQIFSDEELARSFDQHISYACNLSQSYADFESSNTWTVVGEWSNALNDCALWLNGRGVGARWEGQWGSASGQQVFGSCQGYTGNYSTFSQSYKNQMREYFEVQVEVGESVQGWVFWAWKVRVKADSLWAIGNDHRHRLRAPTSGAIVKG
jgi:glucan 1,3-beta-glucosidase